MDRQVPLPGYTGRILNASSVRASAKKTVSRVPRMAAPELSWSTRPISCLVFTRCNYFDRRRRRARHDWVSTPNAVENIRGIIAAGTDATPRTGWIRITTSSRAWNTPRTWRARTPRRSPPLDPSTCLYYYPLDPSTSLYYSTGAPPQLPLVTPTGG